MSFANFQTRFEITAGAHKSTSAVPLKHEYILKHQSVGVHGQGGSTVRDLARV